MAISKKNKPVVVRRRPETFIEGERASTSISGSEEGSADNEDGESIRELPADKMLLKLRMSNSRQLPVWAEAKDTLWEKGYEASAKAAEAIEAALVRFRRILDAEAKVRDAEAARAELARLSKPETNSSSAEDANDEEE